MARRQKTSAVDSAVEQAYYRIAQGVQIDIFDISKVFAHGRQALMEGRDLDDAIREIVAKIRKN